MNIHYVNISSLKQLKTHISQHIPSFYYGSQTSTVIPYHEDFEEKLVRFYKEKARPDSYCLVNMSELSKKCTLLKSEKAEGLIQIEGGVSWEDFFSFCGQEDREVLSSPTESLALVLSGIATSATGERSFGLGTLRDQVCSIKFINHLGEEQELLKEISMSDFLGKEASKLLEDYQKIQKQYQGFKNGPFPLLNNATDLMLGSEGQLGVVTSVVLKTGRKKKLKYFFLSLDFWQNNMIAHEEVFFKVDQFRGQILSCELLDSKCLEFVDENHKEGIQGRDFILLEIYEDDFDDIYENFIEKLVNVNEEDIFELSRSKFLELRQSVPRKIAEYLSQNKRQKKGTDIQMPKDKFFALMKKYKEFTKSSKIPHYLFGHFGDGHLHLNLLPKNSEEENEVDQFLGEVYQLTLDLGGTPFAEHGVGLLKQKYIRPFYSKEVLAMFHYLKHRFDPKGQFFPQGYLNL